MAELTNLNQLNPTGFQVYIERLPEVSFFCHNVSLPGLTCTNPEQPNMFTRIPVPGDFPQQGQLTLTFLVDEDLQTWTSVYKWMVGLSFPENHEQYKALLKNSEGPHPNTQDNLYSTVTVQVLSSHKNLNKEFVFFDCIPSDLSSLDLNMEDTTISPVTATVTLDFSYFTIKGIGE